MSDPTTLTEAERRTLGCRCWVGHHERFCPVPAVERILAARVSTATPEERFAAAARGVMDAVRSGTAAARVSTATGDTDLRDRVEAAVAEALDVSGVDLGVPIDMTARITDRVLDVLDNEVGQ